MKELRSPRFGLLLAILMAHIGYNDANTALHAQLHVQISCDARTSSDMKIQWFALQIIEAGHGWHQANANCYTPDQCRFQLSRETLHRVTMGFIEELTMHKLAKEAIAVLTVSKSGVTPFQKKHFLNRLLQQAG